MKIKSAVFDCSAPDLRSSPNWARAEIAVIGRSNVGKSSLINLLTERKDLARVSDLPGKTQLINFFIINESWCLVDLPGYGYAHVAKSKRADFNEAVADFLAHRDNLRWVFVLIDSRLPAQPIDLDFLTWLADGHVRFTLVFTKTDKQSGTQTESNIAAFKRALGERQLAVPSILKTSARTKAGRTELLGYMERVLKGEVPQI